MLKGADSLLPDSGDAVILDVKYEPLPAVAAVLGDDDRAWYDTLFPNEACRAVRGQRALTSYVDPFAGWATIDGEAFVVRQRSPWKAEFDLSSSVRGRAGEAREGPRVSSPLHAS